ncbi:MAG: tyrosine-type recombinase/integrase [Thermoanaerobaculia bacterium]
MDDLPPKSRRRKGRDRDGIFERKRDGRVSYVARVVLKDPETGRRRELTKTCSSYPSAKEARKALEDDAEKIRRGVISLSAPRTLGELLVAFEKQVLAIAPRYDPVSGAKLNKGYAPRLLVSLRAHFPKYLEFFGDSTELKAISPAMLTRFREERLSAPVTFRNTRGALKGELVRDRGKLSSEEFEALSAEERGAYAPTTRPRTVATVNREVSFLRRLLSFAVECGAIESNPFGRRSRLVAAEPHRTRTLSLAEEEGLLLAASQESRAHLRPLLTLLLDTGMRINEALCLTWEDVRIETSVIEVRAETAKTRTGRLVPVTARLAEELRRISPDVARGRVFGELKSVRRSFATACRIARIDGLRLHDLRHTAGSRLAARLPLTEVANILGHRSLETTRRYSNPTTERLTRAAEALEAYQSDERKNAQGLSGNERKEPEAN